jgi:Cu(I)/Ag(I) efflux system membrane fusion protein
VAAAAGLAGGYWLGDRHVLPGLFSVPATVKQHAKAPPTPSSAVPAPAHQHGGPALEAAQSGGASPERKILHYRNPMGLADTSPVPKKDPMGMDYIPVYEDEAAAAQAGLVKISPDRVQRIGVTSEPVRRRNLVRPIRAAATVQFDERRTFVVSPKFEGWIEKLLVNATGATVRRGEPLMLIYSPDLLLAQQEYATIRASFAEIGGIAGSTGASGRLLEGALQRLRYMDFPNEELQALIEGAEPQRTLALRSPYAGIVSEKRAVEGMRFMPGEPLYTIIDISSVWLLADVFEQDLANIALGQSAKITVRAYPGRNFEGRVSYIYPSVGQQTRAARVRVEIPNPNTILKADMYANIEIASPVSPRPVPSVPDSAVIDTGNRQVVLIDRGEGRFEPRDVRLGGRSEGYVEVIGGVSEDERVVTSANFLIDAESNLKTALEGFDRTSNGGSSGIGGGATPGGHQHQ